MAEQRSVVVLGRSIFCASIEASLREQIAAEVVQLDNLHADALDHLAVLRPQLIIVDSTEASWSMLMPYLVREPATALIGLDPRTGRTILVHGQHTRLTSMQQLVVMVEKHVGTP
jgi:hypothetical protein